MKRKFYIGDKVNIVGDSRVTKEGVILDIRGVIFKRYAVRYFIYDRYSDDNRRVKEVINWHSKSDLCRCEFKRYK